MHQIRQKKPKPSKRNATSSSIVPSNDDCVDERCAPTIAPRRRAAISMRSRGAVVARRSSARCYSAFSDLCYSAFCGCVFLICVILHFLICVFLLLFQTPENIFRKIFWNATKHHGNIFLFRKLAFPKNMYFPKNVLQQPNTTLVLNRYFTI